MPTIIIELILLAIIILIVIILTIVSISVFASGDWRSGIWSGAFALGLGYYAWYWIFDKHFFSPGVSSAVETGLTVRQAIFGKKK